MSAAVLPVITDDTHLPPWLGSLTYVVGKAEALLGKGADRHRVLLQEIHDRWQNCLLVMSCSKASRFLWPSVLVCSQLTKINPLCVCLE